MKIVKRIEDIKLEQEYVYSLMMNSILNNKISHAYMLEIPEEYDSISIGKAFAKEILSINKTNRDSICNLVDKDEYPDLEVIAPVGLNIKKENLDALQTKFSTKSLQDNKKIYIIDKAEYLNNSSANSILKFLEEPKENIVAILLVNNIYNVIDTIKSRCQIVQFVKKRNDDVLIDKDIINFIEMMENNKIDTLLKTQIIWHNKYKNKEENDIAFNQIINVYKSILDEKIKKAEYSKISKIIFDNNSIYELSKKIELTMKYRERNIFNANSKLNIDSYIIEMWR